jgi:hypothetical protein
MGLTCTLRAHSFAIMSDISEFTSVGELTRWMVEGLHFRFWQG